MLTLAILGRPNVGKSTLYNRLAGRREAIVHDQPGVTRDRRYGMGSLAGLEFRIIDTPGLEDIGRDNYAGRMSGQSLKALEDADVVLLLIDAIAGITPEDERFARILREHGANVILVANKAESARGRENLCDTYMLGFGEPVAISAEHNEGMMELYEALASQDSGSAADKGRDQEAERAFSSAYCGDQETGAGANINEEAGDASPEHPIRLAILGRPNVGKSTLLNTLLGEERVLTGPEAGMTRDAVEVTLRHGGQEYVLVDTAGMRRKSRVQESLERMAVGSSLNALQYADVVVLVLDAEQPLEKQDNTLAALVEREGRACVIALNKCDLVPARDSLLAQVAEKLEAVTPQMKGIPVVPISATRGKGVDKLMREVVRVHEVWNTRVPTAALNRWLDDITQRHTPPLVNGRRLKFRYITQQKARPPTFILFSNMSKDVPDSYTRYLVNNLREAFGLPAVPIRLLLRTGKNPYAD